MLKTLKALYLPQRSSATRRRDSRFSMLGLLLGSVIATGLALGLYVMYRQGKFG